MIVVDSSAVLAILLQESDADVMAAAIHSSHSRMMSAANYFESGMVIQSRFENAGALAFDTFFRKAGIDIAPVDREIAELARTAFRAFGKGRHKAGLNFGDCFSYALAKIKDWPLLAKGDDFRHTDVTLAI